jgi:hypothetical protein
VFILQLQVPKKTALRANNLAAMALLAGFFRIHLTNVTLIRDNLRLGGSNPKRRFDDSHPQTLIDWGISVTTNVEEFTVPEKILLAADSLDKEGQSPFSAEALIVASWQKFPKTFGLKGYTDQYPDSNKILSSIMGEKGLARRGWLVKMGQKMYALTRDGRQVVRRVLLEEEEETPGANVKLSREMEKFVIGLLDSSAVQKFDENRKGELTFNDACRFWGIAENIKGDALEARIQQVQTYLAELDRTLADVDAELSTGRIFTAGDVRILTHVHRYMEDRFDRHLNLLRTRAVKH